MDDQTDALEAPKVEAGWYPDPRGEKTQRYWNGSAWTEQLAPLEAAPRESKLNVPIGVWVAGAGVLALVVAVFLPYVDPKGFNRVLQNSLIQHEEGKFLIGVALLTALAIYRYVNDAGWWWSTTALGLIALVFTIYIGGDLPELHSALAPSGFTETPSAGIGIFVAGLGGFLIIVGGLTLRRQQPASG
jgi:hypothetical protein